MGTWYPKFLEESFTRSSSASQLSTATIKLQLLTSAYTYNAAHDFYNDVAPAAAEVGAAGTITSTSFTNGLFAGTGPTISALPAGPATQAVVYVDTGVQSTSWLIMHLNSASIFPLTGTGLDQPISWTTQPVTKTSNSDGYWWYPKFAEAFFTRPSNSNVSTGTVKVVGVDLADYTYSASHQFLSDVTGAALVGTPQTIGNKTFTDGVFSSTDASITFPALTGDQFEYLLFYIDTGSSATSRLMLLCNNAQGLPVTPNGLDQPIYKNSSGWARLGAT